MIVRIVALAALFAPQGFTSDDTSPPSIMHEPCKEYRPGRDFEIRVRLVDSSGVFDPRVIYWSGRPGWDSVVLAVTDRADIFKAVLPAAALRGRVEYFVEAFDVNGNGPARFGNAKEAVRVEPALHPRECAQIPRAGGTIPRTPVLPAAAVGVLPAAASPATPGLPPAAPTPGAPPKVQFEPSNDADFAAVDLRAERLYEAALDSQDNPGLSAEQKAAAWCTLAALGPGPREAAATRACRLWTDYARETALVARLAAGEKDPGFTPTDRAKLWCDLATLETSSLRDRAAAVCDEWTAAAQALAPRLELVRADHKRLKEYLALKRKESSQKAAAVHGFLDAHGALASPEVDDAKLALHLLEDPASAAGKRWCDPGVASIVCADRCLATKGCAESGECEDAGERCVGSPAGCAGSRQCQETGLCGYDPGDRQCVKTREGCAGSRQCQETGLCGYDPVDRQCVTTREGCAASTTCRRIGRCGFAEHLRACW